ncbi:unnamed protein product [Meloidogyne enterolobii]|uniref:Uncharacterized protein n=1 Tax=Meloidogyne enterolobii TaxID=390850 RepID=A0ACB0YBS3_MELEN
MKFDELQLYDILSRYPRCLEHKIIKPESGIFEITLNDRLKKKWQAAITESLPLFLNSFKFGTNILMRLEKTGTE